ncbi:MAG TPA: LysM domain-containing protein [Opitutaceae bacterium]|nr:LysM domain-containing protein [Opitutaceae bacterium]
MDTISSRENSNILPVAGVIIGVIALLLSIIAFVKVNSANTKIAAHDEKFAALDTQVSTASASAEQAKTDIRKLTSQTQDAVTQLSGMIGETNGRVTKIEEAQKARPAASAKGKSGEPAVAGPGEYIVKKGDTGASIARANGVSLADLQSVNSGTNWSKLAVGQKLKLPKK